MSTDVHLNSVQFKRPYADFLAVLERLGSSKIDYSQFKQNPAGWLQDFFEFDPPLDNSQIDMAKLPDRKAIKRHAKELKAKHGSSAGAMKFHWHPTLAIDVLSSGVKD